MLSPVLDAAAILLALAGIALLAPSLLLLLEAAASFLPDRRTAIAAPARPPRLVILVPAHDEAQVIADTLASLAQELQPGDRLLVVADNCTDATAEIAERAGAEVIGRNDPARRGKGYALDFGLKHLAADPPEIVIVADADCRPSPGALRTIAASAAALRRPVQARYDLVRPQGADSSYLSIAALAWQVRNYVRPLGLRRLGLPCHLMGTGMAFPWEHIAQADLATGNIVEDIELGLDMTRRGAPAFFEPSAQVVSAFPISAEGQQSQRTRWETGHLQMIVRRVPGLLVEGLRSRNAALVMAAADAAIPPLSLLLLSTAAVFILSAALAIVNGLLTPLAIISFAGAAMALGVTLSALRIGRISDLFGLMAKTPAYAVSKISIYAGAAAGKPLEWIRSRRD